MVELEVEIDPRIDRADELWTWVDEEGRKVLAELPPDPTRSGVLRIGIGGGLYDYVISLTPMHAESSAGEPSTWECECSNEELLERLRGALPGAANRLGAKKRRELVSRRSR